MSVRVLDYSLSPFAEEHFAQSTSLGGAGETGYLLSLGNWGGSGVTWTESPIQDADGGYQAWTASNPTGTTNMEVGIATPSLAATFNLVSDPSWTTGQEWTVSWFVHADSMVTANYYRFRVSLWDGYAALRENVHLSYYPSFPENPLGFTASTSGGPGYTISNSVRLEDYGDSWWKISVRMRDYSGTCTRMTIALVWSSGAGSYTLYRPELRAGNHIQGAPLALSVIEDAERQNILASVGILDATGFVDLPANVASQSVSSIAAPDGTLTAIETVATSPTVTPIIRALLFETTGTYTQIGDLWQDGLAWTFALYAYMGQANAARITLQARTMTTAGVQSDQVAFTVEGGSVVSFSSSSTGTVAYSVERNARVEAVGDTGWYRIELTIQDYARTCDRIYLAIFGTSGTAYDRFITWNPTLRYGDWVSRGKNWLPTTDIIGSWLQGNLDDIQLSSEAAPDGTLSAVDVYPTVGSIGTVSFNQLTSAYGWPDDARYTWEFYIKHPLPVSSPTCYFNCTVDSTGGDEQWWPIIAQDGGFTGGIARNVTSGPGYSIADDAEAVAIGTDGWWRYRFSMQQFDTAATIFQVQTSVALRVGATGQKITIWNPRLTVGNPADMLDYFVSGPQNLLGDGSDYDPATSNWSTGAAPRDVAVTTNTDVAPNGRLEADTLTHTDGQSPNDYLTISISKSAATEAVYYNFYYKIDTALPTGTACERIFFRLLAGATQVESINAYLAYGSDDPVISVIGTTTGGPGYTADDITVTAISNDWVRVSIRLFDYSGTADNPRVLHYNQTPLGTGVDYDVTLWGSEITTIDRASFTPPSLGEVTTFGSPISYSWAKLRLRRGTDGDRATLIGMPVAGEPIYCTDTKTLFIGDGTTRGGSPAVKPPTVVQLTTSLTTNINNATTDNLVEWDTQDVLWGDDISHDTVTNSGRITIDTDGIYEIACTVRVNATGTVASDYNGIMRCRKNGTTDFGPSSAGGYISYSLDNDESSFHIPGFVYQFSAGDYFEILIDRESSQNRGVYLTANKSFLYIKRIA